MNILDALKQEFEIRTANNEDIARLPEIISHIELLESENRVLTLCISTSQVQIEAALKDHQEMISSLKESLDWATRTVMQAADLMEEDDETEEVEEARIRVKDIRKQFGMKELV